MKNPEISRQSEADAATEPTIIVKAAAATALVPQPRIDTATSAHGLALAELRRLMNAWRRHEPLARMGQDPEELHQLRVTVRRIDATLALFKHQLPASVVSARKNAKGMLRALGAARDLDVQLGELSRYCADLSEAECAAAEPLRQRLEAEAARAHARVVRLLDAAPTRRWLEELSLATGAGAGGTASAAGHSAFTVMPQRVRQRFRKLRKTVRKLPANASMDEFHAVRRRAKQLRYAIETGGRMFGKPAEELLKALRRMQERLGAHQDAYMAKRRLAKLAEDSAAGLPPATLFLMGRLAERQSEVISQASRTLSRSWRRVRGKRWKAMRSRLGELTDRAPARRRVTTTAGRAAATVVASASPSQPQAAVPAIAVAPAAAAVTTPIGAPEHVSEPERRSLKH
jgi:CHAD domain-containing protein